MVGVAAAGGDAAAEFADDPDDPERKREADQDDECEVAAVGEGDPAGTEFEKSEAAVGPAQSQDRDDGMFEGVDHLVVEFGRGPAGEAFENFADDEVDDRGEDPRDQNADGKRGPAFGGGVHAAEQFFDEVREAARNIGEDLHCRREGGAGSGGGS